MSDCTVIRENMPLLLTGALPGSTRELAHQHIEQCLLCDQEWQALRETWASLESLPEVAVPSRVRDSFLRTLAPLQGQAADESATVVAFRPRRTSWWLAQAAAAVLVAGTAFWAGQQKSSQGFESPATVASATAPVAFSLSESRTFPASEINPNFEGKPNIQNVRFHETAGDSAQVGVSFDLTSRMTITGNPNDRSLVKLLSYLLQNENHPSPSRSDTIQWVKETYGAQAKTDPEIVKALANVLKNDTHEGVRIKAVETLRSLPATQAPEARAALIEALRNDPNPAVRIKAVEALAKLATSGGGVDPATVDSLRQKAAQDDENLYVRVKAAEALSQINL